MRNRRGFIQLIMAIAAIPLLLGGLYVGSNYLGSTTYKTEITGNNPVIYGPPAPSPTQPTDSGTSVGGIGSALKGVANSAISTTTTMAAVMPLLMISVVMGMFGGKKGLFG